MNYGALRCECTILFTLTQEGRARELWARRVGILLCWS